MISSLIGYCFKNCLFPRLLYDLHLRWVHMLFLVRRFRLFMVRLDSCFGKIFVTLKNQMWQVHVHLHHKHGRKLKISKNLNLRNSKLKNCSMPQGGTLIFSSYVGSGPASTVHQKNIRNFKCPKQIFEILATQKNTPIMYVDLKKRALNIVQFCDDPQKISTKSSYPKNIFIFLKTPKIIEIQKFEPQKMAPAYVCMKISEYPTYKK